jgi:hypothetical protein
MQQSEQITSREAAAIIGCDIATVNRMAKDGRLPRMGKLPGLRGHNLFNRTVVELVAEQRRRQLAEARSA